VAAAGAEVELEEGGLAAALQHAIVGDGLTPPVSLPTARGPGRRAPDAEAPVLHEHALERPLVRTNHALDDRHVHPLERLVAPVPALDAMLNGAARQ